MSFIKRAQIKEIDLIDSVDKVNLYQISRSELKSFLKPLLSKDVFENYDVVDLVQQPDDKWIVQLNNSQRYLTKSAKVGSADIFWAASEFLKGKFLLKESQSVEVKSFIPSGIREGFACKASISD
jgi:hypothetical protein